MKQIFSAPDTIFAAWYSEWNDNTYLRTKPFREQPCRGNAGSTAGAPVALGDDFLVGLIRECDAVFEWDGIHLTVEASEESLFISTAATETERWREYHQALGITFREAPFGLLPEYCTWVEQIRLASEEGGIQQTLDALTPALLDSYLNTVKQAGWPIGRFTMDSGWSPFGGAGGFGDWIPKTGFDMAAIAENIQSDGHIPGLWLAPALIARDSLAAIRNPELVGRPVEMDGECEWTNYFYLNPSDQSQELINELFQRVFDWGFRKFKLDIFYGPKPLMRQLSEQCRIATNRLSEPVELEGHIPDPFCAQHMDVIRINDLLISDQHPRWRDVFDGHVRVCRNSAPGMVLNFDHIGGNCADVDEQLFIEHLKMVESLLESGYLSLSLLPQHIGGRAVRTVENSLNSMAGADKSVAERLLPRSV